MEKYILYTKKGKKMMFGYESKTRNYKQKTQFLSYYTFYYIEMAYIEQMNKGTFKHSYSLEEATILLKKFHRAKRKYKNAGKHSKGYWNDLNLIIIPISKLLKLNKKQLKQRKRVNNERCKKPS